MKQSQRDFLIGLYAAGLVMWSEGILEVASSHGATWWASSGQRHVALGGLLFLFAIGYALCSRKKQPKDDESKKAN